ncbi:hypothetical protein [Streptomyces sp. NBC_01445]|uniref:hypothetical protein n=1 Tax=Streptomyces sp. NBC_01445 TaxID=2903869 RepID=UPI002DD8A3D9|nr:hypothetical protein [Streptomyces sp. NBC_01445]WSE04784.1 hypothetical protein OG574_16300 [Streptomyces sp. NBC_01445]
MAAALGAASLVASVAGCSSSAPEREYATPKELCGIKVSAGSLEPLLPPGKKIAVEPTAAVGVKRCRLEVDGKVVFSTSVEKRGADTSARDVATSAIGVNPNDPSADNGRFIYSKTGAVGRVECSKSAGADSSFWVTARVSDDADPADMHRFVKEYATAAAGSGSCAEG